MKIAIIGYGHVGHAMYEMFSNAVIYDEPLKIGSKESVNECYAGFVCVPTPEGENGKCDTSVVEDVISWLDTDIIIIRSTVPVGFTNRMADVYKKKVVFQPEYYGETIVHPFANIRN